MSSPSPVHVDLGLLASAMHDSRQYPELERRIRRFHGKVVVKTDLDQVRRAIDELNGLLREMPAPATFTGFELAAGEALCVYAVVAYCRALVSDGSGRFPTGVKFPPDLAAAHDRIASLRNRRLAHYGRSESEEEASWADDRAVAVFEGDHLYLRFATSRRGWDNKIIDDLDALTAFAIDAVTAQATAESNALADELIAVVDQPEFIQLALRSEFSPRQFFDNPEQADAIGSSEITVFSGMRFSVLTSDK